MENNKIDYKNFFSRRNLTLENFLRDKKFNSIEEIKEFFHLKNLSHPNDELLKNYFNDYLEKNIILKGDNKLIENKNEKILFENKKENTDSYFEEQDKNIKTKSKKEKV